MRSIAASAAVGVGALVAGLLLAQEPQQPPGRVPDAPPPQPNPALRRMAPAPAWGLSEIWLGERAARRIGVEGNIIDLNCYVEHAGFGEHHRRCGRICAERGLPLGFIDSQGRIYVISGPGHVPTTEVNKPLLDHVESTVRVSGYFFDHQDVKLLAVEKVERAPEQMSAEALQALYRGPVQ